MCNLVNIHTWAHNNTGIEELWTLNLFYCKKKKNSKGNAHVGAIHVIVKSVTTLGREKLKRDTKIQAGMTCQLSSFFWRIYNLKYFQDFFSLLYLQFINKSNFIQNIWWIMLRKKGESWLVSPSIGENLSSPPSTLDGRCDKRKDGLV